MHKTAPTIFAEYNMNSIDGNDAVHNFLEQVHNQFWTGLNAIKAKHPEVMQLETSKKIWDALKYYYHTNPADLTTLQKESKIGDYVHYKEEVKGILHDKSEDNTEATLKLPDGSHKRVKI